MGGSRHGRDVLLQPEVMKLDKPTAFVATGRVHVWKDGTPFYVFDRKGGMFTLPAGTYRVEGGAMLGPIKARKGAKLPRPRFPLPRRITLRYCDNPHKAQVDLRRGVVYLDNGYRDAPDFVRTFILLHEVGHYFFEDEEQCDRYAAVEMYKRGYNASQVYLAAKMSLSHHAADRVGSAYDNARALDDGQ